MSMRFARCLSSPSLRQETRRLTCYNKEYHPHILEQSHIISYQLAASNSFIDKQLWINPTKCINEKTEHNHQSWIILSDKSQKKQQNGALEILKEKLAAKDVNEGFVAGYKAERSREPSIHPSFPPREEDAYYAIRPERIRQLFSSTK